MTMQENESSFSYRMLPVSVCLPRVTFVQHEWLHIRRRCVARNFEQVSSPSLPRVCPVPFHSCHLSPVFFIAAQSCGPNAGVGAAIGLVTATVAEAMD